MSNRQAVAFHEVLGDAPTVRRALLVLDPTTGFYRFASSSAGGTEAFAVRDPATGRYRLSADRAGRRAFAYLASRHLVIL